MTVTNATPDPIRKPLLQRIQEDEMFEINASVAHRTMQESKYQRQDIELFTMLQRAEIHRIARNEAQETVCNNSNSDPKFDLDAFVNITHKKPVKVEIANAPAQAQSRIPEALGWLAGIIGIAFATIAGVLVWM